MGATAFSAPTNKVPNRPTASAAGFVEVMRGLVMSMVSNPIDALLKGNYIGILVWAIGLGFALRHGNETTKNLVNDMSNAVTFMVKLVIRFAPIGIFGLVSSTLATTGFSTLWGYAQLLVVLVGCMLLVAPSGIETE